MRVSSARSKRHRDAEMRDDQDNLKVRRAHNLSKRWEIVVCPLLLWSPR